MVKNLRMFWVYIHLCCLSFTRTCSLRKNEYVLDCQVSVQNSQSAGGRHSLHSKHPEATTGFCWAKNAFLLAKFQSIRGQVDVRFPKTNSFDNNLWCIPCIPANNLSGLVPRSTKRSFDGSVGWWPIEKRCELSASDGCVSGNVMCFMVSRAASPFSCSPLYVLTKTRSSNNNNNNTNQPTSQPTSQPTRQPTSQTASQLTKQANKQTNKQTNNWLTNWLTP